MDNLLANLNIQMNLSGHSQEPGREFVSAVSGFNVSTEPGTKVDSFINYSNNFLY